MYYYIYTLFNFSIYYTNTTIFLFSNKSSTSLSIFSMPIIISSNTTAHSHTQTHTDGVAGVGCMADEGDGAWVRPTGPRALDEDGG